MATGRGREGVRRSQSTTTETIYEKGVRYEKPVDLRVKKLSNGVVLAHWLRKGAGVKR